MFYRSRIQQVVRDSTRIAALARSPVTFMKTLFRSTLLLSVLSLAMPGLVLADTKKETKKEGKKVAKAAPAGPVDLNNATQSELEALNGVGPSTAKKIIAGRPYMAVGDLSKAGVSGATIAKITPMVMVGKAAAAAAVPVAKTPAAAVAVPAVATPAAKTVATPAAAKTTPAQATAANTSSCAATMVWANTESKIYHTSGDRWFGNTKKGQCMTEASAQAAGYRAAKEGAAKKK